MKSIFVFLLSLVICCTACAMPKAALNTTHRLQVQKEAGIAICSATAVGKHTLVTAAHCDSITGVVLVDGELTVITDKIFDNYDHEFMVVKTTFKHIARFANTKAKVGHNYWICGNPRGIPRILREGVFSGNFVVTDPVPGIMDGLYNIHMYDMNTAAGDSGAAVFNSSGEIVDIVSVSFIDNGFHLMGAFELHFTSVDLLRIK